MSFHKTVGIFEDPSCSLYLYRCPFRINQRLHVMQDFGLTWNNILQQNQQSNASISKTGKYRPISRVVIGQKIDYRS